MPLMSITIDEEAEESFVGLDFDKHLPLEGNTRRSRWRCRERRLI